MGRVSNFPQVILGLIAWTMVLSMALVGCGGSSGGSNSRDNGSDALAPESVASGSGRAVLTVRWPDRASSKLIPFAANSIRVRLTSTDGTRLRGEALLVRPASGGTVSASFDRLPTGPLQVTAEAHPGTDGTGVTQAGAQTQTTIEAGKVTDLHLTLASTIDRIELTPAGPLSLLPGQSQTFAAAGKNAAGEIVLTNPSTIAWVSMTPAVATVDASGLVKAVAPGSSVLSVKDLESGKSATTTVTVIAPGPQTVYTTDFQGATVGPEWSLQNRRQDPLDAADLSLGGFVNQTVRLSLNSLPAHGSVTIAFDLYVLNSWDGLGPAPVGGEIWSLRVADTGPTLLCTNFNNNAGTQSYPGTYPTDSYPARTGATVSQFNPRYTVYRITKTFAHTGATIGFDFSATGLEDFAENETWSIDDVTVSVQP